MYVHPSIGVSEVVQFADFDPPTQAALVERGQAGDARAIGQLYDETFPLVYQVASRLSATREDAEDITAETYERAIRKLHCYRSQKIPIAAWLCAIARNVAREQARRRRWPPLVFLLPQTLDSLPGTAGAYSAFEDDLLGRLTAAQREVISLRLAGFNLREIARSLGKADGTVRSLQFGALKRLRAAAAR